MLLIAILPAPPWWTPDARERPRKCKHAPSALTCWCVWALLRGDLCSLGAAGGCVMGAGLLFPFPCGLFLWRLTKEKGRKKKHTVTCGSAGGRGWESWEQRSCPHPNCCWCKHRHYLSVGSSNKEGLILGACNLCWRTLLCPRCRHRGRPRCPL